MLTPTRLIEDGPMPEFILTAWTERVLRDSATYVVVADTMEQAAALLWWQTCATPAAGLPPTPIDERVTRLNGGPVRALDPAEVVDGSSGVTTMAGDDIDFDPEADMPPSGAAADMLAAWDRYNNAPV